MVVLGNGLIGAAAAKFIVEQRPAPTCYLIGAAEGNKNNIYSSHYDAGRVTHQIGKVLISVTVRMTSGQSSVVLPSRIMTSSNGSQAFNFTTRLLVSMPHLMPPILTSDGPVQLWLARQLPQSWLLLNLASTSLRLLPLTAGAVLCLRWGPGGPASRCHRPTGADQSAEQDLHRLGRRASPRTGAAPGEDRSWLHVAASDRRLQLPGRTIEARQVLVAAGLYTNQLLRPLGVQLDVQLKSETVVLAEVSRQTFEEYSNLPSLLLEVDLPAFCEGTWVPTARRLPDQTLTLP